ncbi:MAG: hypothetical protein ACR2QR_04110 [Woeseiaceae bacterium]
MIQFAEIPGAIEREGQTILTNSGGAGAILLMLMGTVSFAQEQHADYVVVGKSVNTRQSADGELTLLNTVFFAEIFGVKGGEVNNGYLHGPGDATDGLQFPAGDIQFIAGERQFSIKALTEHFPDTTYFFSFDTPDGNVRNLPATFRRDAGEMRNPGPIGLTLQQGGEIVDPQRVNPDKDLTVIWTPFDKGAPDPRGIAEDMIYVMMGDCMGNETVHSGHAISDLHALTYTAEQFVIAADNLYPGQPFQLEVEHSNMDTDVQQDIEVIVTYAATTFLDIRTLGADEQGRSCPAEPLAMDGGQTDRQRSTQ